ncbi:hypothetical protein BH09SUM1_BH09SUM1_33060 [soil metagenome]
MARQARSDFEIYKILLRREGVARSHALHYLQMATEKLAKALTTPVGGRPRVSHTQFVRFVDRCKGIPALREYFGYRSDYNAFKTYMDTIVPAAEQIENLVPESRMVRPNTEYPWEDRASRDVIVPCDFPFVALDPRRNEPLRKLIDFLEGCFRYLEQDG